MGYGPSVFCELKSPCVKSPSFVTALTTACFVVLWLATKGAISDSDDSSGILLASHGGAGAAATYAVSVGRCTSHSWLSPALNDTQLSIFKGSHRFVERSKRGSCSVGAGLARHLDEG